MLELWAITVYEGAIGDRHNMILGHEGCGEIVEVGSEVKDFVCNKTDTTVAGYEVSDTEIYNLVNEEKAVQAALDSK